MAEKINTDRFEQLLDEVARLTGESKTETIRRALEERRDRLARSTSAPNAAVRRYFLKLALSFRPASAQMRAGCSRACCRKAELRSCT